MIEKVLSSWREFRDFVDSIRFRYGYFEHRISESEVYRKKNTVLFRGHGDASWPIQTTLERKTSRRIHLAEYMMYAVDSVPELQSLTGKDWKVPPYPEILSEIHDKRKGIGVHLPHYDYLVYLRHHGFPSPLLDWTESPYIAAFFAFWQPAREAECVAVFVYIDSTGGGRSSWLGAPTITPQGPYVTTHPRHFAQKSRYTIATEWNAEEDVFYFCSHEGLFRDAIEPHDPTDDASDGQQDLLFKVTLPISARVEALRELSDYNINPFTLFQTEDALVRAMELKGFDLEDAFVI
jgi:hypothetical protein